MTGRLDGTKVAMLLLYAAASIAWLIALPLWLWDHQSYLLGSLPWALNCLGAPLITRMGIRQRRYAVAMRDPSLQESFVA